MSHARPLLHHLPDDSAFYSTFQRLSHQTAHTYPSLNLSVPHEILRDDIIPCIEQTLGTSLDVPPRIVLNCFNIDASGVVGWKEFRASLLRMKLAINSSSSSSTTRENPTNSNTVNSNEDDRVLNSNTGMSCGPSSKSTKSHKRLMEARRRGRLVGPPPQSTTDFPLTSAQEVGWQQGQTPAVPRGANESCWECCAPIRGTDVTKGGEGRNIQTYFGPFLGRSF